jgi:hypothetical protein
MTKSDPKGSRPSLLDAWEQRAGEGLSGEAKPSAAVKLAQLNARAHREADPGKRPI